MSAKETRTARRVLETRLSTFPPAAVFARPNGGWVRAIRQALGMSATDLAARLEVTAASIHDLERSERAGRARLDTLQRAAAAMDCDLVYALVPRVSLEETVRHRARSRIDPQVLAVARAMDLEAQSVEVDPEAVDDEMQRLIDSGRLWK